MTAPAPHLTATARHPIARNAAVLGGELHLDTVEELSRAGWLIGCEHE